MKAIVLAMATVAALASSPVYAANLLVNGDFEASTSPTTTPTGWTNVGHSDGVIPYTIGPVPAYDGNYFYDLGGYGDASGPVGDGIQQAVATIVGAAYTLTFGLSSEDVSGQTVLLVSIGGQNTPFLLTAGGTYFLKGFTTQTINYVATSSSTLISFIEQVNMSGGNNDPMIDGVIFSPAAGGVPEPATWAMMVLGVGFVGGALRSRRKVSVSYA